MFFSKKESEEKLEKFTKKVADNILSESEKSISSIADIWGIEEKTENASGIVDIQKRVYCFQSIILEHKILLVALSNLLGYGVSKDSEKISELLKAELMMQSDLLYDTLTDADEFCDFYDKRINDYNQTAIKNGANFVNLLVSFSVVFSAVVSDFMIENFNIEKDEAKKLEQETLKTVAEKIKYFIESEKFKEYSETNE
jgi:hypothetical protein